MGQNILVESTTSPTLLISVNIRGGVRATYQRGLHVLYVKAALDRRAGDGKNICAKRGGRDGATYDTRSF